MTRTNGTVLFSSTPSVIAAAAGTESINANSYANMIMTNTSHLDDGD